MAPAAIDPRVERTRRVVRDATIDVIAEHGFGGATIEAIATRSGVARSTIYRNWGGRTELLLDSVRFRFGPAVETIVGDLRQDLLAVATRLTDLLTNEPMASVAASLLLESRRDPALADLRQRFAEGRMREIVRVVDEAKSRGELGPEPDGVAIASELGGPIFLRAMVLRQPIEPSWLEAHVDAVVTRYRKS